jgi:hypothetical protein
VEEPIVPDSCPPERDLEIEQLDARLDPADSRRRLEQLRRLMVERKGDASLACLYNAELLLVRHAVRQGTRTAQLTSTELTSFFPAGIEAVQRELARGVSDLDVRGALLLSAGHGELLETPDPIAAIQLFKEAVATAIRWCVGLGEGVT